MGVKIGYACERVRERLKTMSRPFGSAVDMRHVQDFSGFLDETMPVLCSDALTDSNIGAALHEHRTEGAFANVVALDAPSADVQNYGTMVAAEGGEIQSAEAPPLSSEARSTLASTDIYTVESEVLKWVPPNTAYNVDSQLCPNGSPKNVRSIPKMTLRLARTWADSAIADPFCSARCAGKSCQ